MSRKAPAVKEVREVITVDKQMIMLEVQHIDLTIKQLRQHRDRLITLLPVEKPKKRTTFFNPLTGKHEPIGSKKKKEV